MTSFTLFIAILVTLIFVALASHNSAEDNTQIDLLLDEHIEGIDEYDWLENEDLGGTCVTTAAVNVRAGPSTSTTILGVLQTGQSIAHTGNNGVWAQVNFNGRTAYMHSDYLKCNGAPSTITCYATTAVNVRAGPSTGHAIYGVVQNGQSVTKIGTEGVWAKVSYNGKTGFMHSDYLRCGGSPAPTPTARCHHTKFPHFLQCDPRWGNDRLGSVTICKVGCLISSVAEALYGLGKKVNGQVVNPGVMNNFLKNNGGYVSDGLFVWGSVGKLGLAFQGKIRDHNQIRAHVCSTSHIVILAVNNEGHYVLAVGVDANGNYIVRDPGYANKTIYTTREVVLGAIYKI